MKTNLVGARCEPAVCPKRLDLRRPPQINHIKESGNRRHDQNLSKAEHTTVISILHLLRTSILSANARGEA